MFLVQKLNIYGLEHGCYVNGAYGPFGTRDEADAFRERVEKLNLVGVEYDVREIESPQKLVDFLNQLGMGTV
jgi:hypothetical protein